MSASALVIAPNWIGDAVMAQPLLALLRQREPALRIDALCTPLAAAVFRSMREVDETIETPPTTGRLASLAATARLGWKLRERGYRRAYLLPDAKGPALSALIAGIPERFGHAGQTHPLLVNRPYDGPTGAHPSVEHYARLAFPPHEPLPGSIPAPRLVRRAERERAVRARYGLGASGSPLILLCPGAESATARRWPTRHYAALASLICDEWPEAELAVLGSARERATATEIAALSGQPVRNLAGQTSIEDAIAIVAQAGGIVSGDCGLMHVAAAYGRPQVAVFGGTDPRRTPPRSPRARVEWLHLDCSPCLRNDCALGDPECLARIAPATVFDSLSKAMRFEATGTRPVR